MRQNLHGFPPFPLHLWFFFFIGSFSSLVLFLHWPFYFIGSFSSLVHFLHVLRSHVIGLHIISFSILTFVISFSGYFIVQYLFTIFPQTFFRRVWSGPTGKNAPYLLVPVIGRNFRYTKIVKKIVYSLHTAVVLYFFL